MLRRFLYIPYYILHTSPAYLIRLFHHAKKNYGAGYAYLLADMLYCTIRYNIAFIDYFDFKFFTLTTSQRSEYMGSGAMYEYQLVMNPKKYRTVLSNKTEFLKKFDDLSGRKWATLEMLRNNNAHANALLRNNLEKIVIKNDVGQAGKQVEVLDTRHLTIQNLIQKMENSRYNLAEEYIEQHDHLNVLSPSGVNTVRIITQIHHHEVIILAARLRITINSSTDNLSTGNIAAHIDLTTGRVAGPGIYVDTTKPDEYKHPVTGVELIGFPVPYWSACLELVKKAALRVAENRSIGWDVAVTQNGPVLIEGNHNWHYFLWQAPEKRGYKKLVQRFLEKYPY